MITIAEHPTNCCHGFSEPFQKTQNNFCYHSISGFVENLAKSMRLICRPSSNRNHRFSRQYRRLGAKGYSSAQCIRYLQPGYVSKNVKPRSFRFYSTVKLKSAVEIGGIQTFMHNIILAQCILLSRKVKIINIFFSILYI